MSPVSFIIYNEVENAPRLFYYMYYVFKLSGTTFKIFWDFYYDWGLFRGSRPETRLLRDKMKFHPKFYYVCMLIDIIGHYFWFFVIVAYHATESTNLAISSLEFYSNIMWITWVQMLVVVVRSTAWVLIRFENEFFSNFE